MNAGAILRLFYDAVQQRDMVKARSYLDDQMTFAGLFETYPNADGYCQVAALIGETSDAHSHTSHRILPCHIPIVVVSAMPVISDQTENCPVIHIR
jgi:hypothetical protein